MSKSRSSSIVQFLLFSFIGIFMFFAQITVGDQHGIPIDLLTTGIINGMGVVSNYLALLLVVIGAAWPFIKKPGTETLLTLSSPYSSSSALWLPRWCASTSARRWS